jgi:hypothetical protein
MADETISGKIRFSRCWQATLDAKPYTLVVEQRVAELQGAPLPSPVSYEFVVSGPRFALNPADIYSVYPPEGATGDFKSSLPHIVFARPTIPWERKVSSASPGHRPWMALLLFSAEDGVPAIEPRKVRDLFEKLPPGVCGPLGLVCQDYELDDPCNAIDLDAELFRRVAPSEAGLDYLAHVRAVDTNHKETASFLTDGSFSVVIGNRFPSAKTHEGAPVENRVMLVSLEGLQDFLPGSKTQPQSPVKAFRLAVLANWAFHCEESRNFKASMFDLQNPLLPLRLDLPPDEGSAEAQYVSAAFSRGYTALNHHTRLGEKTFSWYRGPLVPLEIQVQASYKFNAVPDGLVRYDKEKGLMDVAYAGAAQLGRLLGLQDRAFAQALSAWRTETQREINERLEKEELRRTLRSTPASELLLQKPESEFLELALEDALTRKAPAAARSGGSFTAALKAQSGTPDEEPPATVRDWLARRVLLYGVPFLYLVPDERMLPLPSMRFFRIDPLWIKRLLEGACSVGRNSTQAEMVDEMLGDYFFRLAVKGCAKVRRRPAPIDGEGPQTAGESADPTFPFEGFLLRSPIVRGWQGLEMEAWYWKEGETKSVPAPPLRIDRLAPDIMLCIFNGPLERIEIRQPPEGMHFGAASFGPGSFKKASLRNVTATAPGRQIDLLDSERVGIPFRKDQARVVDVPELAKLLQDALSKKDGMGATPFTSAEFAVQMTESPGKVVITVKAEP